MLNILKAERTQTRLLSNYVYIFTKQTMNPMMETCSGYGGDTNTLNSSSLHLNSYSGISPNLRLSVVSRCSFNTYWSGYYTYIVHTLGSYHIIIHYSKLRLLLVWYQLVWGNLTNELFK